MKKRPRLRRFLLGSGAVFLSFVAVLVAQGWVAFGHRAEGARRARMERSPQYHDGRFVNPEPLQNDFLRMLSGLAGASDHLAPDAPLRVVRVPRGRFEVPPADGLRVTWLGHSTTLVELDGARVLTDPVFSERPSPIPWLGPERWYPPPIAFEDLPRIDAVVVSHDHYDHLDHETIVRMKRWRTRFVVPLGVGAHLEYWGIPRSRIVELDWWERARVGGIEIVCTPARHASGRILIDDDATLWAGYALIGPRHRVYYSGDTGLFRGMRAIGERLGPFDLAMIEVGQYDPAWPDWHIGPEQAIEASLRVRAERLLPVHWGLLALAYHGWTEPIERVLAEARRRDVELVTPRPGESVEPEEVRVAERWWPRVPFRSGRQSPIVSHDAD